MHVGHSTHRDQGIGVGWRCCEKGIVCICFSLPLFVQFSFVVTMSQNGTLSAGDYSVVSRLHERPWVAVFVVPLITYLVWSLYEDISSPLRKYPGPFLARKTSFASVFRLYVGTSSSCCYSALETFQKLIPTLIWQRMDSLLVHVLELDGQRPARAR